MADEIAISVEHVSKDFILPHQKVNSLKALFMSAAKTKGQKSKEIQHALKDISFSVKKGEFFGIVGRNGSGKSTLLKILAGIYQPNSGHVKTSGKLVPFIELGVGFNPELTGRENVYLNGALLGFSKIEVDAMYDGIVEFAELGRFMDQKLKNYSSGMQVRLAFSVAVRAKAGILLIDEVLAVGDADFQRKCFEYFKRLKQDDVTVVFVSHDMSAVQEYCERAILIDKNEIIHSGNAEAVANEYTKLFINQPSGSNKGDSIDSSKRWGDGAIKYTSVGVSKEVFLENDKIKIELIAEAYQDVEDVNFGFLIRSSSGESLLGSNTHIKKNFVKKIKQSSKVHITWELDNVFNDGRYYVEPAIVYNSNTSTGDWWQEATGFVVRKQERTPYAINPSISLELKQ